MKRIQIRRIWRFRWAALVVTCTVCLVGWLVVLALQDTAHRMAELTAASVPLHGPPGPDEQLLDFMLKEDEKDRLKERTYHAAADQLYRVDLASEIAEARARLGELLLKYTDKHPDVIEARRVLEELERRRKCQLPEDDPKKRQYHALADRLESAEWSEQDLCFQLYPLKPSDGEK